MNSHEEILGRARRAYERARLEKALRTAALVGPLVLLSFGGCTQRAATLAAAGALALLTTALVWHGGPPGRAVIPGFFAGAVALAFPLLACPVCARAGVAGTMPLAACVAGGLASGALVASFAARLREGRASFVVAAGAVAALAGSLGCAIAGLGGVAAMALGLTLVAPLGLRAASVRS